MMLDTMHTKMLKRELRKILDSYLENGTKNITILSLQAI